MKLEKLLKEIINQERIIKSAIEARDLDIVESAIKVKGELITELEKHDLKNLKANLKEMVDEIIKYDESNVVLMEDFKLHMNERFNADRKEKLDVQKNRTLTNKYKNPYADNVGGVFIDRKK